MNLREAEKLQSGAIVRESFRPESDRYPVIHGLVIGKSYVKERHNAAILGGTKEERYDVVIHWLCDDRNVPKRWINARPTNPRLQVRQNWELMIVSHATS